ncbi:SUKH-3 domain-containing protein [Streptomyces sp. NPDC059697]|uniref:SUKH-3 domain-containing protein n=1 Tax=Streptomyces sp. NPDC059697 TaxID=3346912 RepID=UPI0036CE6502
MDSSPTPSTARGTPPPGPPPPPRAPSAPLPRCDPQDSRAREPFELDPELAWGENDRFSEWSDSLGRHLFPLGELDHGRFFPGIDEGSEICLLETWVASFGPMPHALENLILGVMPRRFDDEHRQSDQAR